MLIHTISWVSELLNFKIKLNHCTFKSGLSAFKCLWWRYTDLKFDITITQISHPKFCLFSASWERRWLASPCGQQDRVRPAWPSAGPEEGLPANQRRGPRGETLQGLHLQLLPQVHEHSAKERWWRLPHVQQRSVGDCPEKVRREQMKKIIDMSEGVRVDGVANT